MDDLPSRLEDIGRAWALLKSAELTPASLLEQVRDRYPRALQSPAILVRLARALEAVGAITEADTLLGEGSALTGPAPQLALARGRLLAGQGRAREARPIHRAGLLSAQPDAALLIEHAEIALADGDAATARAVAALAPAWPAPSPERLVEQGRRLAAAGQRDLALAARTAAFMAGMRDPVLLTGLQEDAAAFPEVLAAPYAPNIPGSPSIAQAVSMTAGEAMLAETAQLPQLLSAAAQREAGSDWLTPDQLSARIAQAIAARAPFSYIRVSDGEARFLLARKPALRPELDGTHAHAAGAFMWSIWFGQSIADVDEPELAALGDRFDAAIRRADVLGLPTAERLATDRAHAGYLVALERYASGLPSSPSRCFADAGANLKMNAVDPLFERLLGGLDFLSVVSPHADLAGQLGARLGIECVGGYVIPGEGRLARAIEGSDRGTHFPTIYQELLRSLVVPRPGAVFLVAGGLLGKIYCDHIRGLGGIAIDIGALADAWMGHNTRGSPLAAAMRDPLTPA